MTDRELLELAAKSAGMDYLIWTPGSAPIVPEKYRTRECLIADKICWNPLHYDGDALRLAVKLNLQIECMTAQTAARTFNNRFAGCVDHADSQQFPKRDFNPDPYAATRRAIVRAAAEIGKEKQNA